MRESVETERFVVQPVNLFLLARRTYSWTRNPECFVYLGTRTENWTFRRWYRDLRGRARRAGTIRAIIEKASQEYVGLHIVHLNADPAIASTTIMIGEKRWWGKGVHREVSTAMIDHCFSTLGIFKISSAVADGNHASIKNTLALGYRLEGTLRGEFKLHDGSRVDKLMFGITRADWEELRRSKAPAPAAAAIVGEGRPQKTEA